MCDRGHGKEAQRTAIQSEEEILGRGNEDILYRVCIVCRQFALPVERHDRKIVCDKCNQLPVELFCISDIIDKCESRDELFEIGGKISRENLQENVRAPLRHFYKEALEVFRMDDQHSQTIAR